MFPGNARVSYAPHVYTDRMRFNASLAAGLQLLLLRSLGAKLDGVRFEDRAFLDPSQRPCAGGVLTYKVLPFDDRRSLA